MTYSYFIELVIILIIAIILLYILTLLPIGSFFKSIFKDEFKTREQIGRSNIGKTKKKLKYKEIAKTRNLQEAKTIEVPVKVKATPSLTKVSAEVMKSEVDGRGKDVRSPRK